MATTSQLGTLETLKRTSTATITSQLLQRGLRNTFMSGLIPLRPDLRMAGYAFTLRYVPSREDIGIDVNYDNETNVQRIAVELDRMVHHRGGSRVRSRSVGRKVELREHVRVA